MALAGRMSGEIEMFIRSERLFLRPGWPEDWREILARIGDERIVRNLAQVPWPYTEDDARSLATAPQDWALPHFLVTLPGADGARIVGCAGLSRNDDEIELGYWIGREHWGQGYATEAARAVLGLARALGHRRLAAHHFIDNPASGRVLAKIGFRPTGQTRERFCRARGELVPAFCYELDLVAPDNGSDPLMRLAA